MVELSFAIWRSPRTAPLLDGTIEPEGIRLVSSTLFGSETFWRQLKFAEFDVSEMSSSSMFMLTARGNREWVALPVFPQREFFHTWTMIRVASGIERPEDLRGKRVGVPEYQQTAAVWSRGILQHEFGVEPREIRWFMERNPARSHGQATGFSPPPGVEFSYIPETTTQAEMLINGELDATLLYISVPNLVDRSRRALDQEHFRPLYPDAEAEGRRYVAKTGIYPINHMIVVRRSIVEREPWVAESLVRAFVAAKEHAAHERTALLEPYVDTGLLDPAALEPDPMPYGLEPSRHVLETLAQYEHEQGLTPRRVALEELFAPEVTALAAAPTA